MKKVKFLLLLQFLLLLPRVFALEPCPDPLNVTECCLMYENTGYLLGTDIKANGDCFVINGTYIDCRGHTITGDGSGIAINISNRNYVFVINCSINNFTTGINVESNANKAVIKWNKIFDNYFGILLRSGGNRIIRNIIITNDWGLGIYTSIRNLVYDNYIVSNRVNADDTGSHDYNITKTSEINIIGGPYIGGNYWDDYSGEDLDGDGLGDTDLPFNESNRIYPGDYLPLVDFISPKYLNIQAPIGSLLYSSSATYEFIITWKDNVQLDKVIFELDGVNYTPEKIDEYLGFNSNYQVEHIVNYSISFTDLEPGTHYYRWYANDTRNNWNSTELFEFTINQFSLTFSPNPVWAGKKVQPFISCSGIDCSGEVRIGVGDYKVLRSWNYSCSEDGCPTRPFYASYPRYTGSPPDPYIEEKTFYASIDFDGDGVFYEEGETVSEKLKIMCHVEGAPCSWDEPCCGGYYCSFGVCKKVRGGGCPFVYVWDGNKYVEDNNILPRSESSRKDVEDYYLLHKPLVEKDGKYSLIIKEYEKEHDFFDEVKLIAVDHDPSFKVGVDPNGKILTYKDPVPPISAIDDKGRDITDILGSVDGVSYEGSRGDYIILNFGKVNSKNAKLVIRSDWRPPALKLSIHTQIFDSKEKWKEVISFVPRANWAVDIINLSDYVDPNEDFEVRLYFTSKHKIDFVGLDTSEEEDFEIHEGKLISAIHSTQGDVKDKLLRSDKKYAELKPGEEVKLEFSLPNKSKEVRDFILYSRGHYYTINPLSRLFEVIREFFISILK